MQELYDLAALLPSCFAVHYLVPHLIFLREFRGFECLPYTLTVFTLVCLLFL